MTFSVIVPTIGRDTLELTLESIVSQLHDGDEVIVVRDSFEDADPYRRILDRVCRFMGRGPAIKFLEHDAGYHYYGIEQTNHGFSHATGDVVFAMSDDDVYVPGAFDRLREVMAADPLRPVLFRFLAPWRQILWDRPRMKKSHISGQCIAVPRQFNECFSTEQYPEVDFDWMVGILERAAAKGKVPIWLKDVLVIARPELRNGKVPTGVTRCEACLEPRYFEDVDAQGQCVECAAMAVSA